MIVTGSRINKDKDEYSIALECSLDLATFIEEIFTFKRFTIHSDELDLGGFIPKENQETMLKIAALYQLAGETYYELREQGVSRENAGLVIPKGINVRVIFTTIEDELKKMVSTLLQLDSSRESYVMGVALYQYLCQVDKDTFHSCGKSLTHTMYS